MSALRIVALYVTVLTASALRPLAAQRIRCEVFMPDSVTHAAGIVVEALDARRAIVARALSGARGEFDLAMPAAGVFTVRALRIGFRPTVAAAIDARLGEVAVLRIVLEGRRAVLAAVSVRSDNVCGVRPDSGRLTSQLWEQISSALAATQLAASMRSVRASWTVFERSTAVRGGRVLSEKQSTRSGQTRSPFVSLSPDSLARHGYIAQDRDGFTYYAPDADVLLSESFAALHCFRVEPAPAAHAGWVGLGFSPRPDSPNRYDVEGVLWIERASAELRSLTFRYTGQPRSYADAGVGGDIDFVRLGNGSWIVSRWEIRTPRARRTSLSRLSARASTTSEQIIVDGLVATGGMVTTVDDGGTSVRLQQQASLALVLYSPDTAAAVAGSVVTLVGTERSATADSAGRVRIDDLMPGRYQVAVVSPEMRSLGLAPVTRDVEALVLPAAAPPAARAGTVAVLPAARAGAVAVSSAASDSMAVPSGRELVRTVCGAGNGKSQGALLYGTVSDGPGKEARGARGATVSATWLDLYAYNFGVTPIVGKQTRSVVTEAMGTYRLCGAPADKLLRVEAQFETRASDTLKVTVPGARPTARVDLVVKVARP